MNEQDYQKIIENIEKEKKYEINNGKLYRIKKDKRLLVIRRHEFEGLLYIKHNHELSAHFGINATYEKIIEKYYWKGMRKDIEIYVKSCDKCQRRGKPIGRNELYPIEVKEPFYQIGIDFIGPLKVTKRGNRYIIVAIDYFTKYPEAKAVKKDNAETVADFIYEEIICRHGLPQKIISDRGSHFKNKMIEELMKRFNIKHKFSTSYHPQTNGLVERFNKTLCESLAKLEENNDWDKRISPILFAYRTKKHSSSKVKPFYLTYGREPRLLMDETNEENDEEIRIHQLIEELPKIRRQAEIKIKESQQKQKDYYDKKNKRKEAYQIGDKVLKYDAAKEKQWSGKLEEKWKGPFYVHEILLNGSYKIKEIDGRIIRTPVNGNLLKRYYDRKTFEPMVVICEDTNFSGGDSL